MYFRQVFIVMYCYSGSFVATINFKGRYGGKDIFLSGMILHRIITIVKVVRSQQGEQIYF